MTDESQGILRQIVETRRVPEKEIGITREIVIKTIPGKTTIFIGVRRAGKSTMLSNTMGALRQKGVPRKDILYVDFFDERLSGFKREQFQSIVDAFLAERGTSKGKVYAFFDEIQETEGWEGFIHRVQQQLGWQVWLTGSSSRMLSKEISTKMRGRAVSYELFPYSFLEYLRAKNLPTKPESDEARALIARACETYLEAGAFPEVTDLDEETRRKLHQEYFSSIVQRDLILRNDAAHPVAVRDLCLRLMHDNACLQSLNRLTAALQVNGHATSKTFVSNCLDWMHDAFLFFPVPIFTESMTKRKANPSKWYSIDTGMVRSVVSKFASDNGRLLENMVFLALRRKGYALSYHRTKSGKEIDFVYKDEKGKVNLVQVCWELGKEKTRKRELDAIEEAMGEIKSASVKVITWHEESRIEVGGKKVEVLPAWRFLLD